MSKKILITGASGVVGTDLTRNLLSKNYAVVHLGRTKKTGTVPSFVWDVGKMEIDEQALDGVDTIVHLAGANVGDGRWTAARKKEIIDSRVQSSQLLYNALKNKKHSVKAVISASAVGYYGFDSDQVIDEKTGPGKDFLAQVTKQWEEAVDQIKSLGIRVVKVRIGIALSMTGGALKQMAQPVKLGFGALLGSGKQYVSWLHLDDLCGIFMKAIEDEKMNGPYNAAAAWATNEEITKAIARILKKPLWLPNVPPFMLRLIIGQMAEIVLTGSKVSSEKIKREGFHFRYQNLDEALQDILMK
ncbi:NAD-dependent epimerase [Cytophagales bacterium WSM2-2]|nr:NAD-dependent epimerase [Cytophagales bacterium WSM2-2]